jgi:hypothetical protein
MLIKKSGFRAFNEFDLAATLENQLKKIKLEIESDLRANLSSSSAEYISEKIADGQIKPIELRVGELYLTSSQQMIPTEYFPSNIFFWNETGEYEKEVLTVHLPFSGDPSLLRSVPSTRILWTEEIALGINEILFDVINFNNDADAIKTEQDKVINFLKSQLDNVNRQVNQYNSSLEEEIKKIVDQTKGKLSEHDAFLAKLGTPIMASELVPKQDSAVPSVASHVAKENPKKFDVFICHASEDKPFVTSLAEAIKNAGIEVWYDDFQLGWGDDLRQAIDNGLKNSRYGIVVFSKAFFARKKWTEYELSGLFAREKPDRKIILPIWHEITRSEIEKYSPSLADRFAKQSNSIGEIINELGTLLKK